MTQSEKKRLRHLEELVDLQDKYISGKIDELEYIDRKIELTQKRINVLQKEAEDIKNWILQQGVNKEVVDDLIKITKSLFEGV